MTYLLIPLLCVLAVSKVTLQARFSKTANAGIQDKVFYNCILFLTAALLFFPTIIKNGVTFSTCVFGVVMGVLSVAFQLFYICAFSKGKMTLTVIINNFSMILPITVSFVFFHDEFGIFKILGTVLALVSFLFTTEKTKNDTLPQTKKRAGASWLLLTLLVFLSNGLISVNQKVYSALTPKLQVFEFVAVAYLTATVLSLAILGVIRAKDKSVVIQKNSKVILSACLVGILLGVFQCIYTYATSVIDGTILYPIFNCGVSLLSTVTGRILFKENLSAKQYISVCIGTMAIVLLCL